MPEVYHKRTTDGSYLRVMDPNTPKKHLGFGLVPVIAWLKGLSHTVTYKEDISCPNQNSNFWTTCSK